MVTMVTHYCSSDYQIGNDQVMTGPHCCHWQPTVTDGRIILVKSLILNILYSNGHRTEEATLYTKKNVRKNCD